jgi:hypothetical protein
VEQKLNDGEQYDRAHVGEGHQTDPAPNADGKFDAE